MRASAEKKKVEAYLLGGPVTLTNVLAILQPGEDLLDHLLRDHLEEPTAYWTANHCHVDENGTPPGIRPVGFKMLSMR